jgi:hypothetical protein
MIHAQVHDKFKIFIGKPAADHSIGTLAAEVAAFAKSAHIAAKSIGVEYLESSGRLLITLGYRDDETPYPIKLHSVPLGKIDPAASDFAVLEKKLGEASGRFRNIICHELFVTKENDFMLVLMTHEA